MISFIVSGNGTINAVVNNRQYVIPRSHRNYERAKAALATGDPDIFTQAVDYQEIITRFATPKHRVEIIAGHVHLNGTRLHNVITERILALAADGWPWAPVGNFLENIQANPSYRSIQELYKFLEHRALPITENGHFLGYKSVTNDWRDKHTKTFDNRVGQVVKVPRNTVNDDFREGCSSGLHVGSIEYVKDFHGGEGHIIICRVNPRDVVSVPADSDCTKLRCCEYEVVGEYTGDLTGLVYTSQGNAVPPPSRNDPAQGVTIQPPSRADWAVGQDVTAVATYNQDTNEIDVDFVPIRPGDKVLIGGKVITAGDVLPGDERNALDDDNFDDGAEASDSSNIFVGSKVPEPSSEEINDEDDPEDDNFDEDDEDLDDDDYDDYDDDEDDDDGEDEDDDGEFVEDYDSGSEEITVETEIPVAEATDEPVTHEFQFNQEYGGSD